MRITKLYFSLFLLLSMTAGSAIAQWTTDSTVNTMVRDQSSATVTMIATAPNGNSFITWAESNATGGGYQMRMQLVDSNGFNLWGSGGIVLDTMMGSALYRYDLKVDDSGNAIMATQDESSGGYWPVAFKVDQSGNMLWGASGIQLTDPSATSGLSPVINFTDSNNVLIAWTASGTKSFVSFQKISPDGTFLWTDNGNIIDPANAVNYERAEIVRTTGEQFLIQYVKRSGFGLGVSTMYAQSFDGQGNTVWATPTEVSTFNIGFAAFPAPVSDGYGGFFITFTSGNPSSASSSEAYAQRVYSDGHIWGGVGVEMGSGISEQRFDEGGIYVPSQNKYFVAISATDPGQGHSGVSMQAIDTAGNLMLASNPQTLVPISTSSDLNASIVYVTGIKSIDTGVVILYEVGSTPSPVTIKAIETDYNGNFQWADTAITVSAAQSDKLKYEMGNYTHGQIVVAWTDERTPDGGVYAQNILGGGYLGTIPFVCPTITVSADTMGATVGTAYNDTVSQAGGVGTIAYSVTNGALPSGITLSSTGVLSGTTLASGTYIFTVTATDSDACTGTQTDTLVVNCPTVALTAFSSICDTAAPLTLTGGTPTGGTYSGTDVSNGVFTPTANDTGTFNITYTYTIGNCVDSATQSIVVTHCATNTDTSGSGIINVASVPSFQCAPNPSNGIIAVKINGHITGDVTVKMLDMAGRVMWTDVQGANGTYSKTFNISNYPKGIYMLQASCAENSNTMKIVLQ